ncbi:MAG: T9SS type A sorting domain-containing protein [Ignavibacteria bacterium]|nr:T9SS type A sorting domain-containing protein [Ignavibacteria bacterium]
MRKLLNILLALQTLLIIQTCFAQSITWQRLYHPVMDGSDEVFDMCTAGGTDIFVVGFTATPLRKIYLLKINQFGDTIWTRVLNSGEGYAIVPTNDSGCIFAGYDGASFACKVNKNGMVVWYRNYNSGSVNDISLTNDGNFILCSGKVSGVTLIGYVIKIDTAGNVIWEKPFPASTDERFYKIDTAIDGGYIIVGDKYVSSVANSMILKINDTGAVQWYKTYILSYNSSERGFITAGNKYMTVGVTAVFPNTDSFRVHLAKINLSGDTVSTKIFNANIFEATPSIAKLNENRFAISILSTYYSKAIITDSNLNIIRSLTLQPIGGFTHVFSACIVPGTNVNDIILGGWAGFDAYLARVDSLLTPPPPIGIANSTILLSDYSLFQNYPNPFNSETLIKFTINKASKVKVEVYDILGRKISTTIENYYLPDEYSVRFDAVNLSSGIYFYTLLINGHTISTKKMILIK